MMIYNPRIKNPLRKKIEGNFYSLSIPTTILDIMAQTNSFRQSAQQALAMRFARNYEYSQSLLRPVEKTIRFFGVDPGGGQWVLDNGSNLRVLLLISSTLISECKFSLRNKLVRLVDYVRDPLERDPWESWDGIEDLILQGAEEQFGEGTEDFLRAAYERQEFMKDEIARRYAIKRWW